MIALLTLTLTLLPFRAWSTVDEWYVDCEGGNDCGYARGQSQRHDDCQDLHPNCRNFALWGECQVNPGWMYLNCPKYCGQCQTGESDDEPCHDMHTNCPKWASEYECFANPGYMSHACRKSCWLCVNATNLREEGVSEEDIQRRKRFSQMDFGFWQTIPKEDQDKVRKKVIEMGKYAMTLDKVGPGTLCNNVDYLCATWVVKKGGCDEDLEFLLPRCSLACEYCDLVEEYYICRAKKKNAELVPFGDLAAIQTYLFHTKQAKNLLDDFSEPLDNGEWIFALKHSDLWNNDSDKVMQGLISILKSETSLLKWTEVEKTIDGKSQVRSGRSTICDQSCQELEPLVGTLVADISKLLQVKPEYLQPLEFVNYKRGQRFKAHHDFRVHDSWRYSGHRVLTVFIALEMPEKGGSFGFPEYDWLQVQQPQILVWPNISPRSPAKKLGRMKSEQLPVVDGELYGVYATLRQFPYDSSNLCS